MPLDTRVVGQKTRAFEHHVDARWIMAYAAGIQDTNPRYMDTSRGDIIAHPVFPVCLEWPVILSSRELPGSEAMTREERARGVHAAHDLHIFKQIKADQTYRTEATVTALKSIRPGAALLTRLDTFDAAGDLVCRTWQLGISRGVDITGEAREVEQPPALPTEEGDPCELSFQIPVSEGAANVYTETARIWNPIHSDKAFALAAGLPDIILHGTATLALAVTSLVNGLLDADPSNIIRLGGRFTGMVLMPNLLEVRVHRQSRRYLSFSVADKSGQEVFSQGYLCLKEA